MKFARIDLSLVLVATILTSLSVAAQDAGRMRRIGFINAGPAAPNQSNVEGFRAGLRELGYVEGRNIVVDYRWADGKVDRLPGMVNELISLRPGMR